MKQSIITTKARVLEKLNEYEHSEEEELSYASQIARDLNKTYSHMLGIIEDLEEMNLVEDQKGGNDRKKLIKLSETGKELVEPINEVSKIAEENDLKVYYG